MKCALLFLITGITVSCSSPVIEKRNWYPPNHRVLNAWLENLDAHPAREQAVAVFDFDNTCIYGDVGEAILRYQLDHLRFRLEPQQLAGLFPAAPAELKGIPINAIKNQILADYNVLWPAIAANDAAPVLETPAHRRFRVLMWWFFNETYSDKALGARFAFPLLGRLLAGLTVDDVTQLTDEALVVITAEPLGSGVWKESIPNLGSFEGKYHTGLQPYQEMSDLIKGLEQSGVAVHVVSASVEWIVETAAVKLGFLPPKKAKDRVFGIRVDLDGDTLTTRDPVNYPVTYREGKVVVIETLIDGLPVLIAGDATTDFEMLEMPKVPLRLIIHRNKSGPIGTLYDDPRFLIQGIATETGRFYPARTTEEPE